MQKKVTKFTVPKILTLCLLWNDSHILLGFKKEVLVRVFGMVLAEKLKLMKV
jgi:hypothetical protein